MDEKRSYYTFRVKVKEDWLIDFGRPLTKEEALKAFNEGDYMDIVEENFVETLSVEEVS